MADVFISYRRKPSASLALLIQEKLRNQHAIDAYVDTTRTDSTKVQFPERLMQAIDDAPVFICLLADSTLDSEWVLKEITRAHQGKKHCVPIFQESYVPPAQPDEAVNYLLSFDGIHVFDLKNVFVDEAIAQIAHLIPRKRNQRKVAAGIILLAVMLVIGLILLMTALQPAVLPDATTAVVPATTEPPSATHTPKTLPSTLPAITSTPDPQETSVTLTPTIAPIPTDAPEQLALTPILHNSDWQPYEREFSGFVMVLVPVGCFEMGSTDGGSDEQPIETVCFQQPYWIDKYEVTQADFERMGGIKSAVSSFEGADLPVERITWFEAHTFCERRAARLPTEAEWEYAARGSDNLIYPWGNQWNPDNAVWYGNANDQTTPVGSIHSGQSWVGAYDMSGNVWEWVSSLYQPYPYTPQSEDSQNTTDGRGLRGGSWFNRNISNLRATFRSWDYPANQDGIYGFRCVRSVE